MSNTLTRFGNSALANNTTGANNSAFGHFAAYSNTDGSSNTAIGANSSFYNVHGEQNTAIGAGSMCNNVGGDLNTAVGSCALEGPFSLGSVGDKNVAIGAKALYDNQGNHNVAVGCYALIDNTDGSGNTAVGYQAGSDLSGNSNFNTFLCYNTDINSNTLIYNNSTALGYNATIDASNQFVLGTALESVYIPGSYVGIGNGNYNPGNGFTLDVSGNLNTTMDAYINSITVGRGGGNASSNTAIGFEALQSNIPVGFGIGQTNTAVGYQTLKNNIGGFDNTAVGYQTLNNNGAGINNTAVGVQALYSSSASINNTAFGNAAGFNTSGNYNTFLGANTDVSNNAGIPNGIYNNSTALGYNATIDASNQIVLGGQDPSIPVPYPGVYIPGSYVNIGGTYDPSSSYVLDVSGNVNASNYLTNYSSLPTFTSNMIGYSFSSGLVTLTPVTWNVNGVAITNFAFPSLGVFLVNFTVGVTTTTTSINQSLSFAGIKTAIGNSFVNNQYVEFQMPTYQYISTPLFYSSGSLSLTINVTSTTTQYYIVNQTNNFNIDILGCTYNYVKIA